MLAFFHLFNTCAGALLNRLRGSGRKGRFNFVNKWALPVFFGLEASFSNVNLTRFDTLVGVPVYQATFNPVMFILCLTAMKIVCMIGRDVGGFYSGVPKQQNNLFDGIDPDRFKDDPVRYTIYRLTLQGLLSGFLIALPLRSLWPILGGATMGFWYWLGCYIIECKYHKVKDGLRIAELSFGGCFYLSCSIALWHLYIG